jgi:hypothetical protein
MQESKKRATKKKSNCKEVAGKLSYSPSLFSQCTVGAKD